MSNAQHTIEDDGYEYTVQPLTSDGDGISLGTALFYSHFMQAFEDAQKSWAKKIEGDEALRYYDAYYAYSMVLAADGSPCALIMNVDDIPQTFTIKTMEKIEVDK